MERAAPVRSSHTSTAGLLAWPHPDGAGSLPARRPNQPTEEFRNVVFGGQLTEGADGLNKTKRKTGSSPKGKETTGTGISKAESAAAAAVATASRDRQASQITFSQDGTVPTRKATSVAGVARQRELSHTVESEGDSKMKRQVSSTKSKELSGHDIFADHEDPKPNRSRRSDYGSSAAQSPVKNANVSSFSFGEADIDSTVKTAKKKGSSNLSTDLNGKTMPKKDSASAEKQPPNRARPKGMSGSSNFADGKASTSTTGDHEGRRTRQPPGGDSSILLG